MEGHLLVYLDVASDSLVVWDMDSQHTVGRLEGQGIRYVATWGNMVVGTQVIGPPRLWSLETMQCTATLPGMPPIVSTGCMEGRVLLGSHGAIKVWDVAASAPVPLPNLEGHTSAIWCMKASASTVLSCSADKTVRLWDLRTSKCVRTMEGHTDSVMSVDMDGHCRTAVSGSFDGTVKLWDLGSGRCSETYMGDSGAVRDVVMHESGSSFLSAAYDDYSVNAWVVGSTEAIMVADFTASCPPQNEYSGIRLFANRDLSGVAYCCVDEEKLQFRYWKS